jgi:hypothetical protein
MPPWLLGLIGIAALVPVASVDAPMAALETEELVRFADGGRVRTVYALPGNLASRISAADEELRRHGFRGKMCLEGGAWGATYIRKGGIRLRFVAGRPRYDRHGFYGGDASNPHFTTAVMDEPTPLEAKARALLKRLFP